MTTLPLDRPDPLRPPPAYAELREDDPVARVTTPDGARAWLVTGHDAVITVLTDPRFGVTPPGGAHPGNDTLFQDGERHARLRRLVSRVFTPLSIDALRERVAEQAEALVAEMVEKGAPADLVDAVAAPLSITVIGELLGVTTAELSRFRRSADAALTGTDPAALAQGWAALQELVAGLVEDKRHDPGDDLLSSLITVRDADDGRLSDGELVAMATVLVAAGYLSAANAIAVGAMQLVTLGRLADVADPATREPAVEELLRYQSGVTGEPLPRWARVDLELAGVPVAAGEMVLVRLEAADRDPSRFPDPDAFDPTREGTHLAFGRGPHHCLGAALARLELGAALGALATGLPSLRLAVPVPDVEWVHGYADSGPAALPVTW
ncbi:MAG: cytochrome P450 [Pseudonocardia sp.]|nr:cytochrome P450 [Pseudonocardia sp.]